MKKLAGLILIAVLGCVGSLPAYARTHNKYQGVDRASRKAQKREQKQINRYAKAQRKNQHKMLNAQTKKKNSGNKSLY